MYLSPAPLTDVQETGLYKIKGLRKGSQFFNLKGDNWAKTWPGLWAQRSVAGARGEKGR